MHNIIKLSSIFLLDFIVIWKSQLRPAAHSLRNTDLGWRHWIFYKTNETHHLFCFFMTFKMNTIGVVESSRLTPQQPLVEGVGETPTKSKVTWDYPKIMCKGAFDNSVVRKLWLGLGGGRGLLWDTLIFTTETNFVKVLAINRSIICSNFEHWLKLTNINHSFKIH